MIGQTVSHYRILEKLGGGGMGEVYKARDTRLGRLVAVKMLKPDAVADRTSRQRFLQEAKAASSLNHPHIVTIYDTGDYGDSLFLAMEYVSGGTLASAIRGKPLPVGKALRYATQTADALAAAHFVGIVHRDVKPANLMIAANDEIKVLDFGVAKLTEPANAECVTTRPLGATWTKEGDLVGTVAYMSPEQAEGKSVDGRSDIFSLGIVLYEMLTGQRPFSGDTPPALISAILRDDPLLPARLNSAISPELERVVMCCLEKAPARRFQNAADLKMALEWLDHDLVAAKSHAPASYGLTTRAWRGVAATIAAGALLVFAAGIAYRLRTRPEQAANPVRVTSDSGISFNPALSPDGRLLAYSSDRGGGDNLDIWVQQLPGGVPVRRTTDPADDGFPSFSPDGNSIVFERAGGGILVMGTFGGNERMLAAAGLTPRFSPEGSRVAYWVGDPGQLSGSGAVYVVPLDNGAPKRVGAEFARARYPLWAPDGKHVLVQGARSDGTNDDWWVVPVDSGAAINTGVLARLRERNVFPISGPGDWTGNDILFSGSAQEAVHIWEVTLKGRTWAATGDARQVTSGATSDLEPSAAAGRVAFCSYVLRNNLWRLTPGEGGHSRKTIKRLSATAAVDICPSASADGRIVAFLSRRPKTRQVWLRDLADGHETELTTGPGDKSAPAVSADGSMIAYAVTENGRSCIYTVSAAGGGGAPRRVCEDCGEPSDWTPDRKSILYTAGRPRRIYALDPASGERTPVVTYPEYNLDQAHLSPDGRWIAFVSSSPDDRSRIYVAPFNATVPAASKHWIAATDGKARADKPRWMNGEALIYYSERDTFGCLWKQRLNAATKVLDGPPAEVYPFHTPRLSLKTIYRGAFEVTVAHDAIILNISDLTGNIWLAKMPQ